MNTSQPHEFENPPNSANYIIVIIGGFGPIIARPNLLLIIGDTDIEAISGNLDNGWSGFDMVYHSILQE